MSTGEHRMATGALDLGLSKSAADRWMGGLAFLLPLAVYLALPSSILREDGLGYYYLVVRGDWMVNLLPAHLLYLPVMMVLGRVARAMHPSGVQLVMQLVDQLAGAGSVYLLFRLARHLGINRFGQWLAALGLAFSFGVWKEASNVKTYAPALCFVVASIDQMVQYAETGDRRRLVALGVMNSIASLFHLGVVFLGAASLALIAWTERGAPRRLALAVGAYAASIALFLVLPLLVVGFGILNVGTVGAFLAWLKTSGHGYRVVVDALSIPRALYGFARTFVYLEFFWDAPKWVVALKILGFLAAAVWATRGIRSVWTRLSPTAQVVLGSLSVFVLLEVAFGVYFYPSDTERWIFILPVIWLVLAAHLSLLDVRRRRIAAAGLALMFAINLVQAIWPAATDSAPKDRVQALDAVLPRDALAVTPGQDWLDYYRYYTSRDLDSLDLVVMAIQHGGDPAGFYAKLDAGIAAARRAGRSVVMIRILDPTENYRRSPWPDLDALGYPAERIRLWAQRYQWEERRLTDPEGTRVYWLR